MSLVLQAVVAAFVVAGLIGAAWWWAYRSYRNFISNAQGLASSALPVDGKATALDNACLALLADHPAKSGLRLLLDNADAFIARAQSAGQAGRSLDLMYYIWSPDIAGWLLIETLVTAADRGVRVRLLLDDVNVQGFDRTFLALSQHPLIEVRLFNPIRQRGHALRRAFEMAMGLARFNRRMHGKMWIADGRLAIIGGRNIADTYFGADEGNRSSVDADILLLGPKVADVSEVFDSYWNLGLSLPIVALWPSFKANSAAFRGRMARHVNAAVSRRFLATIQRDNPPGAFLSEGLHWTDKVQLLADPPDKAYGRHTAPWMDTAIATILDAAKTQVQLITPYFVPGVAGMAGLAALTARGVKVSLITNALSATDIITVHGAYRHYRGPLLAAGAQVYEFSKPALTGRKSDVLHSKVFVIDGQRAIIGSLNFDLRSAYVNTELGLLFEQPQLVADLVAMFDTLSSPDQAYRVTCDAGGALHWAVKRPGVPADMLVEPESGWSRRAVSWIVGRLPIQQYL